MLAFTYMEESKQPAFDVAANFALFIVLRIVLCFWIADVFIWNRVFARFMSWLTSFTKAY